MGFKQPQPDPTAIAMQGQQQAVAQRDKITLLSGQLDDETRLRARRFGTRSMLFGAGGGSVDATGPVMQAQSGGGRMPNLLGLSPIAGAFPVPSLLGKIFGKIF